MQIISRINLFVGKEVSLGAFLKQEHDGKKGKKYFYSVLKQKISLSY